MKKLTYTTAIIMAMATTSVFAHHPAVEMVDSETYDMITAKTGVRSQLFLILAKTVI